MSKEAWAISLHQFAAHTCTCIPWSVCCMACICIVCTLCRPVPTPNWRAPRPLTPPPAPVQQGHPLSAPPAQEGYLQTAPGQQGAPAADSAGLSQDSAAMSAASVRGPSSHADSSISDDTDTVTVGYAVVLYPVCFFGIWAVCTPLGSEFDQQMCP